MCFSPKIKPDMSLKDVIWWLKEDIRLHQKWIQSANTADGSIEQHEQWITVFQECIKLLEGKQTNLSNSQIVKGITDARGTHEYALTQPESKTLGDYAWQQKWILLYDNVLRMVSQSEF
jgi:hypothetical protein